MKKFISFMTSILMIISITALFASAKSTLTSPKKMESILSKAETVYSEGGKLTETYDSKGNITKKAYVYGDGRTNTETTTYTYDAVGNLKKSVSDTSANYGFKENETTTNTFDSKGNLTKSVYKYTFSYSNNYSDTETTTTTYTYDSKGNLTKSVCIKVDSFDDKETTTITNTYDSKGNLTKKVTKVTDYDNKDFVTTDTYNSSGNVTKSVYTYTNVVGKTDTETTTNTYDSNGNLTKSVLEFYDDSNSHDIKSRIETTINTYDSNSNLTKSVYTSVMEFDDDDDFDYFKETETTTNTYDANGNLTKSVCKFDSLDNLGYYKSTETTTNTYDSNGNLTKNTYKFEDTDYDNYSGTTTNTYDSKGNLTKSVYKDTLDGETVTTTYTYKTKDAKTSTYVSKLNGETQYTFTLVDVCEYTGSEIKPDVIVRVDGKQLEKFKDYTLSFANNINFGTGKVTVKFVDSQIKDVVLSFKITLKTPTELKATQTTSEITLNWKSVSNAAKYEVYMYNTEKKAYEKKTTVTKNTATIKSLKAGTSCKFYVVAVDSTGKIKSAKSAVLSTATKTTAPTELKATTAATSVTLNWKKVSGASKYEVYMYNADKKAYEKKTTVSSNTATVKSLKTGTSYKFYVIATDSTGKIKSAKSSVVTAVTKLTTPTELKATQTTTSVTLTWKKVSKAAKYEVYMYNTSKKAYEKKTTVTTNKATIKELKAGTSYKFYVIAVDSTGKIKSAKSAVLSTGTKTTAPTVTLKSSKSKTATATWKKVAGASKYVVYKSTDNKNWTKVSETTKLTYDLTKLSGGKKIYVKVVAVNAYKVNSAYSKVVSVTVKK